MSFYLANPGLSNGEDFVATKSSSSSSSRLSGRSFLWI